MNTCRFLQISAGILRIVPKKAVHTMNSTYSVTQTGGTKMDTFALILSIIGALNWGLVGIFRFDLVAWLFGGQTATVSRILYTLIGLAGLWCISLLFRRHALTSAEDA